MKYRLILLFTVIFFTACADDNVKSDDGSDAQVGSVSDAGSAPGTVVGHENKTISYEKDAVNDTNNVLSVRNVYFDFNSNKIKSNYMELVKHHGKYLSLNSDVNATIEGHADERGTREYNVALGDRRAQAIKRVMQAQGASSSQITIISYGEEKPAAMGHDESAWSQNRRGVINY